MYVILFLLLSAGPDIRADISPADSPDLPVARIDITDVRGNPITEQVEPGRLILVSGEKAVHGEAEGSLLWIVEPSQIEYLVSSDGKSLSLNTGMVETTLRITQIVAKGDRAAYLRTQIKIGNGDKPPPGPEPNPNPNPAPVPPVVTDRVLTLSIVEDATQRTAKTALVLQAAATWNDLKIKGHDWIVYDVRTTTPEGKAAVAVVKDKLGNLLPAIAVYDRTTGKLLNVEPFPDTLDGIAAIIKKNGGKQ